MLVPSLTVCSPLPSPGVCADVARHPAGRVQCDRQPLERGHEQVRAGGQGAGSEAATEATGTRHNYAYTKIIKINGQGVWLGMRKGARDKRDRARREGLGDEGI